MPRGLGHGGSSEVIGCSSSGCILKVIKMKFANRSDVGCERERELLVWTKSFGHGGGVGRAGWEIIRCLILDMLGLRWLLDIQVKVLSRHLYIKV